MTTKHNQNEYFPWEPDKQNHKVNPRKIALSRIFELCYTLFQVLISIHYNKECFCGLLSEFWPSNMYILHMNTIQHTEVLLMWSSL